MLNQALQKQSQCRTLQRKCPLPGAEGAARVPANTLERRD